MSIKFEKPWKSRRVWGAALSLLATAAVVALPEFSEVWIAIATAMAGVLGLSSWTFPKSE